MYRKLNASFIFLCCIVVFFYFHLFRTSVPSSLDFVQIRPVDRKMQYQIQKLANSTTASTTMEKPGLTAKKGKVETEKAEDLLRYRPNPDLLISKTNATSEVIEP